MYRAEYPTINNESKILIGLGDSFTEGQGACSIDIWEKYKWNLKKETNNIEVITSEHKGSWVNQICQLYLTDFTPINLGMRGCGNRAAVKELYLHPQLGLEKAKEKIVVFMITGLERFDFINKSFYDHHHFFSMWPNPWDPTATNKKLWSAYAEDIWDDVFGVIELLLNIAEVKAWCAANNATLILTSAFRHDITQENFAKILFPVNATDLVNIIEWDKFLRPMNQTCMTNMLVMLEGRADLFNGGFYGWAMGHEKLTPKGYLTNCSHPSINGHRVIAESIYNYILKYNILKKDVLTYKPIQENQKSSKQEAIDTRIIGSLEEWDSVINYYRPNGSSKTWYMEELKSLKKPLMWGEWCLFTEKNNEFFDNTSIRHLVTPTCYKRTVKFLPIDKINDINHLYIISVFTPAFFKDNKNIGFSCMSDKYKKDVKEKKCKIVLTLFHEGHSGSEGNDDLEIIDKWRQNEGFPVGSVYFISGNLIGDQICKKKKLGITVLPIHMFEPWNWNESKTIPGPPVQFQPVDEKYLYLTYNRQPRIHRIFLIHDLIKNDIFKKGLVSLNKPWNSFKEGHDNRLDKDIVNYILDKAPFKISEKYNLDYNLACDIDIIDYEKTFISIVTETLVENDCLFLSEKIWKPIIVGHPFMVLGNPNTLKYLKSLGYKTFDKWIDESYDSETDSVTRERMIVSELMKFNGYSLDELKRIRKEMYEICVFNKNHFITLINKNFSDGFSLKLEKYMIDIANKINDQSRKKRLI